MINVSKVSLAFALSLHMIIENAALTFRSSLTMKPILGTISSSAYKFGATPLTRKSNMSLFDSNDNYEDENRKSPVTRESFMREILSEEPEVIVKRKKKNKSKYRPIDNRDSLPFLVKDCSPDPYTKPDIIKQEAKQNTKNHKEKLSKPKKKKGNRIEEGIASSMFQRNDDGSLDKVLGEFQLDKSTNCGDKLEVGDKQYQVLRAKCQYKYAGGKRFIMVRKILEVKDITRLEDEKKLKNQFDQSPNLSSFE